MNVLANLSSTYREFLTGGPGTSAGKMNRSRGPALPSNAGSPYVEMIRNLQTLRQADPALYNRVKREAVASLEAATRAASAAFDIRQLVPRRRTEWWHWAGARLNRLAYHVFPGFGEPLSPRSRW